MSHLDNELFELCKEVYEKTGWEDTRDVLLGPDNSVERNSIFYDGIYTPLYTSDYLLEKLPKRNGHWWLMVSPDDEEGEQWSADYEKDGNSLYLVSSNTPLKALLKLTIALHDAKELPTNKENNYE